MYCRVSSAQQVAEGVSLDDQEARCRAYATAMGYTVARAFIERGYSGSLAPSERPELSAALASLKAGECDGLIVTRLDRLSRSVRDILDIVDAVNREGWRLLSVSDSLDTGTASGRMVLTILAAMAAWERETLAERTRDALAELTRQGRPASGVAPFGFRIVDGKLESDPLTAPALARIAAYHDEGRKPMWIAKMLGAHPRTGRPWTRVNVQSVLRTLARRRRVGAGAIPRNAVATVLPNV